MQHLPNALTISRILITPVILVLVASDSILGRAIALALFVAAAISDYLDGSLARKYQIRSRLGQFLDPVADKILVLGTFVMLSWQDQEMIPWWVVLIIALRDVVVTGIRSHYESRGLSVTTMNVAKWKTVAQLVLLISVLVFRTAEKIPGVIGTYATLVLQSPAPFILSLVVAAITVYTGAIYVLHPRVTTPIKQQ